jgi:D-amino-acid dehydrogenase
MQSFDVMVLGAGIVGVSTALHLQRLGLSVALIDRKHPGEEASFGNAGIVQRNGFVPHAVPTQPLKLLGILFGRSSAVSLDIATVFRLLPWLRQFHAAGSARGVEAYSRVVAPLRAFAVEEHLDLAHATNADRFYRQGGWLHLYRSDAAFQAGDFERQYARVFGVAYRELSAGEIGSLEPGLSAKGLRGVHWPESCSVSNPGAVVDAFWRNFVYEGGGYFRADARKIKQERGGWEIEGELGKVFARQAVVALGAWSTDLLERLGETYPLAVKRGYHMHYRPLSGASLSRPVVDVENGFALTPTDNGIGAHSARSGLAEPAVAGQQAVPAGFSAGGRAVREISGAVAEFRARPRRLHAWAGHWTTAGQHDCGQAAIPGSGRTVAAALRHVIRKAGCQASFRLEDKPEDA